MGHRIEEIQTAMRMAVYTGLTGVFEDEDIKAKSIVGFNDNTMTMSFTDGVGFKVSIELDYEPNYELRNEYDFNDAEREDH